MKDAVECSATASSRFSPAFHDRFGIARRAGGSAIQPTIALDRRRHRHCAGTGLSLPNAGLRSTTATNSGFITGLFVVATPIINRLLFGVKIRPIFWAAVAVSLVGLYLLTNAGPSTA